MSILNHSGCISLEIVGGVQLSYKLTEKGEKFENFKFEVNALRLFRVVLRGFKTIVITSM